jgi:hypothetical protein
MHFDKDYTLEEEGFNVHPHLGSVTYLSNCGPPTVMSDVLQDYERCESDFRER